MVCLGPIKLPSMDKLVYVIYMWRWGSRFVVTRSNWNQCPKISIIISGWNYELPSQKINWTVQYMFDQSNTLKGTSQLPRIKMRIFLLEGGAFSSPAPAAFGLLEALGSAAASTVPGTAPTPAGAAAEVVGAPGTASSCFGGGSCKRKGSCMTPLPIPFKTGSEANRSAYPGPQIIRGCGIKIIAMQNLYIHKSWNWSNIMICWCGIKVIAMQNLYIHKSWNWSNIMICWWIKIIAMQNLHILQIDRT